MEAQPLRASKKAFRLFVSGVVFILGIFLLSMVVAETAHAGSPYTIRADMTGGDCVSIGTWDNNTKTCKLAADVAASGDGIIIAANNIVLDGNGHSVTGNNSRYGVSLYGRSNVTIRNLTISKFSYGAYLSVRWDCQPYTCPPAQQHDNKIYNNNFISNTTQAYVDSFGYSNSFSLASPIYGNYWSNYDSSQEGCNDPNGDSICDAHYKINDSHYDYSPWTSQSAWPPLVENVKPIGTIYTDSTTISADYSHAAGIDRSTVSVTLDGAPLAGCTANPGKVTCPVAGLSVGTHTIGGSVTSNNSKTASISGGFNVADNVAPDVTYTAPAGVILVNNATITATYSDAPPSSGINTASATVILNGVYYPCTTSGGNISCPVSGLSYNKYNAIVSIIDNAGNTGSASGRFEYACACCKPNLGLSHLGAFWASNADYVDGILSLPWMISNNCGTPAYDVKKTKTLTNHGVVASPLPALFGNLSGYEHSVVIIKYKVPVGVGFLSGFNAGSAEDSCGNKYTYP